MYGKGRVGEWVVNLLKATNKEFVWMDDESRDEKVLNDVSVIVVTPGIPPRHKVYQEFGPKTQAELDFALSVMREYGIDKQMTTVGITGTKGKSTTTRVTYNLFKGVVPEHNVRITGNFKVPLSQVVADILSKNIQDQKHVFVIEVSSFMLQFLKDRPFDYAILTNITPDHLNRHVDFDDYAAAKLRLLQFARRLSVTSEEIFTGLSAQQQQKTQIFSQSRDIAATSFLWAHNAGNIDAAVQVVSAYLRDSGQPEKAAQIDTVLRTIQPLEHRLQPIKTIDGITIYDDNMSTNSGAQRVALESFSEQVVLIAGGSDKGDDFTPLEALYVKTVGFAALYGFMAPTFGALFTKLGVPFHIYETFDGAIHGAFEQAKNRRIATVLFSPGCASFDLFKDYYERAERFLQLITLIRANK